jgi:hypothetical protein
MMASALALSSSAACSNAAAFCRSVIFSSSARARKLSALRCFPGVVEADDEIADGGIRLELMRASVVEVRELHRLVKAWRAGGREGAQLLAVLANALAAEVDVPRQALRGMTADDLIQRIVLVRGDREANLDGPVILGDTRGNLRLRVHSNDFPAAPIQIDDVTGGANGDLIVGMRFGGEFDLDRIAMPDGLVVVAGGGGNGLLTGVLVTTDREVEITALPSGFEQGAERGGATGLQFTEPARGSDGARLPSIRRRVCRR